MRREKVAAAPNNRYVGLVLLFSVENGEPLAILPDGVMQRMRVGAANGLGIKYLARKNAKSVGILGSGWQAGAQLMAASAVRDIETIRCFSPNPQSREAFAGGMSAMLGVEVLPVGLPEEAIQGADIVMCATNSIDHVFFKRWIEPGMHLSSIKRPEIEVKAVKRADRVIIHWNDPTPIHVAAKDVVIEEKVAGRGWQVPKRSTSTSFRPYRSSSSAGSKVASPTPMSPASSTISASAISSRPRGPWSTARRRRAASAMTCRPSGSPRTCIPNR
jgi:hypothetical protein